MYDEHTRTDKSKLFTLTQITRTDKDENNIMLLHIFKLSNDEPYVREYRYRVRFIRFGTRVQALKNRYVLFQQRNNDNIIL